jgi:hypothetical protein
MRLALALGCTLGELGARMTSEEFTRWLAFDDLEPLPQPWLQTGVVAATTANSFRGKGKPAQATDFMPVRRRRTPRQSPKQMMAIMGVFAAMHNPGVR